MKSTRSTDRVTSHGVAVTPPSSTAPTLDCPLGTVVNLSPSYINSIKLVFHARSVSGDINHPPRQVLLSLFAEDVINLEQIACGQNQAYTV